MRRDRAWAWSGMCFTGNFALAMLPEPAVQAPVLSQPSLPLGFTKKAQRGALHQRGRPRRRCRPAWRPSPTSACSACGSPAIGSCRRIASTTSARRWATGSWRWRSTRRRATRTGTRRPPTRCSPSTWWTSPASPPATRSTRCSTCSARRLLPPAAYRRSRRARGRPGPGPRARTVPGGPAMPVADRPSGRTRSSVPARVGVAEVGHLAADLGALHLEDAGRVGVGDEVGERLGGVLAGRPHHLHREGHAVGPRCPLPVRCSSWPVAPLGRGSRSQRGDLEAAASSPITTTPVPAGDSAGTTAPPAARWRRWCPSPLPSSLASSPEQAADATTRSEEERHRGAAGGSLPLDGAGRLAT